MNHVQHGCRAWSTRVRHKHPLIPLDGPRLPELGAKLVHKVKIKALSAIAIPSTEKHCRGLFSTFETHVRHHSSLRKHGSLVDIAHPSCHNQSNFKSSQIQTNMAARNFLFAMLALFLALAATTNALASMKTCEGNQGFVMVFQTASESDTKFIYSTYGIPSFQMVVLKKATTLPDLKGFSCAFGPANFSGTLLAQMGSEVANAFGILIPVVYEFSDWSGSASYSDSTLIQTVSLVNKLNNLSASDNSTWADIGSSTDFVYDIFFNTHASSGTDHYNPSLPYDAQSASVAFSINGFPYNGTTSKLAVPVYIASTFADLGLATKQSIDDEYAPTVFLRTELTSGSDAYMFWKPVAYGGSDRDPANSTFALPSGLGAGNASLIQQSLAAAFLGAATYTGATTVSFGEKGDKTYNFGYLTWAFVFGTGKPVEQGLSASLIVTILVANGLPVLALLVGSVYMVYKRFPRKNYSPLNIQRNSD
eukprot:m.30558 g.30558  ORF g.30558 m.30558 type:complete len:478 (+) comp9251_c0_seq1:829-2262(+)